VVKINDYQKDRFAQKIINHFGGDLTGNKIAILGWAFKANTNDSRESAAIYVAKKLYKAGASLEIYDPSVSEDQISKDIKFYWKEKSVESKRISISSNIQFGNVDAIAILTEWEEFKDLDFENTPVFDGRNLINKPFYSL